MEDGYNEQIARICRMEVRKAKVQEELRLARKRKSNANGVLAVSWVRGRKRKG